MSTNIPRILIYTSLPPLHLALTYMALNSSNLLHCICFRGTQTVQTSLIKFRPSAAAALFVPCQPSSLSLSPVPSRVTIALSPGHPHVMCHTCMRCCSPRAASLKNYIFGYMRIVSSFCCVESKIAVLKPFTLFENSVLKPLVRLKRNRQKQREIFKTSLSKCMAR